MKREQEQDILEAEKRAFQVKERPEQDFRIEKKLKDEHGKIEGIKCG